MKAIASTPLWLAAHTLLAAQGEDFFAHLRKAEKHLDAEEIHDLRVASRRLREGLILFSPCFPEGDFSALEKKVKKVTRLLGTLRNTDEAILFFSRLAEEGTGMESLQELLAELEGERKRERKEVERGLAALPVARLHKDFRAAVDSPRIFDMGPSDPFTKIAAYAAEAVRERAAMATEQLQPALEEENAEAQHRLRIAIKHLRYRLEIVSSLVTEGYDELHAVLKGYQEVLGKLHDLDVFAQMAQERIAAPGEQETVREAIAQKRSGLFAAFMEKVEAFPVQKVGERAADAIESIEAGRKS